MKLVLPLAEAIKRKRESAGQIKIEGLPDGASLLGAIPMAGSLILVSEHSVHQIKMADDIDPHRTNFHLGNMQQRLIARGSTSPAVYKTLLTAEVLLKPGVNDKSKSDAALNLSLESAKDLSAMTDQYEALLNSERDAAKLLDAPSASSDATLIPHFEGLEGFTKAFIQKADHVLRSLLDTIKIFYGESAGKGYFEGFRDRLIAVEKDKNLADYLTAQLPFIKFIREVRNCIEHPKPDKRAIVKSYYPLPDGNVSPPTIEVQHPTYRQNEVELSQFCAGLIDGIGNIYEDTLAYLFDRKTVSIGALKFKVFFVPEGSRRYGTVKYELSIVNLEELTKTSDRRIEPD